MKKFQMLNVLDFNVPSEDGKKGIYLIPDCWSQKSAWIFTSTYFALRLTSNIYRNIIKTTLNIAI